MTNLKEIFFNLSDEELHALKDLIPEELKERKKANKAFIKNQAVLLHREVNSLGRNIYTIKEIAELLDTKEYIVANAIKEHKNTPKDD